MSSEWQGHVLEHGAVEHTAVLTSGVIDDLGLEDLGLEYRTRDVAAIHLFGDGTQVTIGRSVEATADSIAHDLRPRRPRVDRAERAQRAAAAGVRDRVRRLGPADECRRRESHARWAVGTPTRWSSWSRCPCSTWRRGGSRARTSGRWRSSAPRSSDCRRGHPARPTRSSSRPAVTAGGSDARVGGSRAFVAALTAAVTDGGGVGAVRVPRRVRQPARRGLDGAVDGRRADHGPPGRRVGDPSAGLRAPAAVAG